MNIKKLAITGTAAALMLASVVPAFANGNGNGGFTLIKNKAKIKNVVVTKADTGGNSISAGDNVNGGKIKTGNAGALADVTNVVNSNDVGCGCDGDGALIIKNKAKIKNVVVTKADTGGNSINAGDDVEGGRIRTGDAGAGSVVTNVVNTNVVGGGV